MEDLKEKTADLADHLEDMAETYYRLTIVNITQKATSVASAVIMMVIVCALSMFVLMFLGIALGFWLSNLLDSRVAGFLLTAAIFLLVLFIILLLRKQTIFPWLRNTIVKKVYD